MQLATTALTTPATETVTVGAIDADDATGAMLLRCGILVVGAIVALLWNERGASFGEDGEGDTSGDGAGCPLSSLACTAVLRGIIPPVAMVYNAL